MAIPKAEEVASSMATTTYHTSLCYRDDDSCRSFIDNLYTALTTAGIGTFRNGSDLDRGKSIVSDMQKAMRESRMSIIIFTEEYASSRWCLDELIHVLERKKDVGHMILPVFHDVDPSHVRKQRGNYAKVFLRYEEESKDKVLKWRAALKDVADLAGVVLGDRREADFIKEIVEDVWNKLSRMILNVARYPVGIYPRVKDVNMWLQDGSSDFNIAMIYGEGGIGKTTIAKTLYDLYIKRFGGGSFLANVRESARLRNGLVLLQRQVLSDILDGVEEEICDVDEGHVKLKQALSCKNILLVLDDVDQVDQLNAVLGMQDWICSGSKVVITTRNEKLLVSHQSSLKFKAAELNYHESLQLFSWHAFGQEHPMKGYIQQSEKLISHCCGNPLALQVLGCSLSGGSVDLWESALVKLESSTEPPVLKVLELGYQTLQDDHEKNLFLDIACFFTGKERGYTVNILDECDYYTAAGIQNLADRCLLTITDDNKLIMHQLLQEMGQTIVSRDSPEPGRRNRVCHHRDALSLLREESGTESVEGLILSIDTSDECKLRKHENISKTKQVGDCQGKSTPISDASASKQICLGFFSQLPRNSVLTASLAQGDFRTDAISRMSELKLLQLSYVQLYGSYQGFPKKLRWLCWHGCELNFIPDNCPLQNLVVLEMRDSGLQQVWEGKKSLKLLKIIDLSHSQKLIRTPNFSGLPNLERVILDYCVNLETVDETVGSLDKLKFLGLRGCKSLRKLPRKVERLKSLETLDVSGCVGLSLLSRGKREPFTAPSTDKAVSDYFHPVTRAPKYLDLKPVKSLCSVLSSWLSQNVRRPVNSFLNFLPRSLRTLDLSDCYLTEKALPADLSILSSLVYLNLSRTLIYNLPESIKSLTMLHTLKIVRCTRLESLPELPSSLKILDARNCMSLERITNLPNFLGSLDLHLKNCTKLVEVGGLFRLQPVGSVDEVMKMWGAVDLQYTGDIEVELWNYLTSTSIRAPLQELYEFGIVSTYLPGIYSPSKFHMKSTSAPISFIVPLVPNLKVWGVDVFVEYEKFSDRSEIAGRNYVEVSNKTKGIKWTYSPVFFAVTASTESMLWLSRLNFGEHFESGDEVIVSLYVRCHVREFGVQPVYHEPEDGNSMKSEKEVLQQQACHYESQHITGGDLSVYQLREGVYLLSHYS